MLRTHMMVYVSSNCMYASEAFRVRCRQTVFTYSHVSTNNARLIQRLKGGAMASEGVGNSHPLSISVLPHPEAPEVEEAVASHETPASPAAEHPEPQQHHTSEDTSQAIQELHEMDLSLNRCARCTSFLVETQEKDTSP